jgi:hypothetical protein
MTRIASRNVWKNHPMPELRRELKVQRLFSEMEMTLIRRGLIPEVMEDKWFIFFENDWLFCHLSWTGACVFAVEFIREETSWKVRKVEVNRDPKQYRTPKGVHDAKLLLFLIDTLLLGKNVQFPGTSNDRPEMKALKTWTVIGRGAVGPK